MIDRPVLVIGAGLSGLASAWYLTEGGARVRVIEAAGQPGGLIQTCSTAEGLVETAARAFTWSERTGALFNAVGVAPQFAREDSRRRYIFRNGRARRWPLSPVETAGVAARFGRAWITRQARPNNDETVETWGTRVIGRPALTWLLAPALQGIYASPPSELSARALFGKKRAPRGKLVAPAGGMGELMEAIRSSLSAKGASFEFNRAATADDLDPAVPAVICTNATSAARLLAPRAPAFAAALRRVRMVSLFAVTVFFPPHADDLRGFGVLFPRAAGVSALGVLFNAEIFTGRGAWRSETWMYGDLNAAALPADDATLLSVLAEDRRILTGRSSMPIASSIARHVDALPVYDSAIIDAQTALETLPRNMAIAGNYLGRLGVTSLLDSAADAASRILA